ncbi:hypothetical protein BZA70DRAFT_70705 [Myxozyma melibiosi]|uniref:Uncharacterized protein n=1 Tax=Myxozyma melibiosi TaxID=54550 RepID=A0ABR1F1A1_9ASCO
MVLKPRDFGLFRIWSAASSSRCCGLDKPGLTALQIILSANVRGIHRAACRRARSVPDDPTGSLDLARPSSSSVAGSNYMKTEGTKRNTETVTDDVRIKYDNGSDNLDKQIDLKRQSKKTELGKSLDILTRLLPNLQHETPPSSLLSPNIQLRLFPKSHPSLPSIRGKIAYLTSWRLAQWILPFLVLGPIEGFAEIADTMLLDDSSGAEKRKKSTWERTGQSMLSLSDKFTPDHKKGSIVFKIMSMRVVNEENSVDDDVTEDGSSGSYEYESPTKLLVRWQTMFVPTSSPSTSALSLSHSSDSDVGSSGSGAVIVGLFTFEFDRHGKIVVHSVDDVQEIRTDDKLAAKGGSKRLKKLAEVVSGNRPADDDEDAPVVADERGPLHNIPRHA